MNTKQELKDWTVPVDAWCERYRLYCLASVLCAVIILFFSVIPVVEGGINAGVQAHCAAYGFFSLVLGLYCKTRQYRYPFLISAAAASLWGLALECLQYPIPYREFELQDMLLNVGAAFAGIVPNYLLARYGLITTLRDRQCSRGDVSDVCERHA